MDFSLSQDDISLIQTFKWQTGYYIKDQKDLYQFFTKVIDYQAKPFPFEYIKKFRELPEFNWKKKPLNYLPKESKAFINEILEFSSQDPLMALKLTAILFCHKEIFLNSEPFLIKLVSIIHELFLLNTIPLKNRLDFCILCVKNWPITNSKEHESNVLFLNILPELFIQFAKENSFVALNLFEESFPDNENYFFSFLEERALFLEFTSYFIDQRPERYIDTLCDYLNYYKSNQFPEEKIRDISKKLYNTTNNKKLRSILIKNNYQHLRRIYSILLQKSYPDELWYPALAYKLWKIEVNIAEVDKTTLDNICIITINSPDNFAYIKQICEKYKNYIISYKEFESSKVRLFEEHSKKITSLLNHSFCEYPFYRNHHITTMNISKVSEQFKNTIIDSYWEMANWLLKYNLPAFFYVLKVAIQRDTFKCTATSKIGVKAEKELFEHIEQLISDYPNDAINFIGKMIGDTLYTEYKAYLTPILNGLMPIVISLNPEVARAVVQKGINYQSHDRQSPWRPYDLHSNPVYKGITQPDIYYI